ncbi:hypothetical protein BKA70DRAFT_1410522 [Coprinopsis sp. MPI-PUGE-AT-0042]|nr:hypothetical protein BKA70DRAFT_1410522 [Coprinopsis sp. MPI-PUGE-AT-0042]
MHVPSSILRSGIDVVDSVSGWAKIAKYAEDNWGTSGGRHVTNPSEYPEYLLQGCTKGSIVPVTFSGTNGSLVNQAVSLALTLALGTPECSESKTHIKGVSGGATTGLSFKTKTGYTQSAHWSVTQSSSLTVGAKFSISVGVKGLGDISAETYMDTTITNERSSSFESSVNREEEFGITLENKDGEQCVVEQVSQICRATGKGDAPIVAQGFFWFFFHESREMKDHPEYGSHYHWVVNIADVLTEEERTSHISFQGPVNTESSHAYMNNCQPVG